MNYRNLTATVFPSTFNKRIHEGIKDVRFKRQSIVSTVRLNGEKVVFVFEGTLNKELFAEYLRVCLAPTFGKMMFWCWTSSFDACFKVG